MSANRSTRRQLIRNALVLGGFGLVADIRNFARAQGLEPTPACGESSPTLSQGEGPFFTPNSPQRADLVESGTKGEVLELEGRIVTRACRPVSGAVIDIWHADENGEYDNEGFRYRGHVYTDANGLYRIRTIVPGLYEGRARHIHAKIGAPGGEPLTTQLYFPDDPSNSTDTFFRSELLLRIARSRGATAAGGATAARFDFVFDRA